MNEQENNMYLNTYYTNIRSVIYFAKVETMCPLYHAVTQNYHFLE